MRRFASGLFVALTAAGLLTLGAPASGQTTLRFSNWVPPTHPLSVEVFFEWGKKVEEATKGRVKIQFVPPLGSPPSHFDLVKDGVADVGMSVNSYTSDRFVLTEGVELPFLAPDASSADVAYWRTHKKFFEKADEFKGVKLIGVWVHGPAHIFMRSKEIKSLPDLAGQKIRVPGGIVNEIAKKLDTVAVFAPAPQSYEIISKGVADGIFFPTESVYSFKIGPAIKYALEIPNGLYRTAHYMIMNQAKWDALSAEDKAAIESVSGEKMAALAGKMWDKADSEGKTALIKGGTTFAVANDATMSALKAKLGDMEAAWIEKAKAKGVDGKAALDYYKEQIKELSKK
jgi:TRAP-type C4-dicarboxylate transport system substrate-binding protein